MTGEPYEYWYWRWAEQGRTFTDVDGGEFRVIETEDGVLFAVDQEDP